MGCIQGPGSELVRNESGGFWRVTPSDGELPVEIQPSVDSVTGPKSRPKIAFKLGLMALSVAIQEMFELATGVDANFIQAGPRVVCRFCRVGECAVQFNNARQ